MKFTKISLVALMSGLIVAFSSCNNADKKENNDQNQQKEASRKKDENAGMHQQHKSLKNNFAHQNIIVLKDPYKPSETTAKNLQEVITAYISLKNAFFKNNKKTVDQAGNIMLEQVESIAAETNNQKAKEAIQQHKQLLEDKLKEMLHIQELEEKRSYFSHLSEIIYCMIKSFDLKKSQEFFAAYCPMALDNKGAYWVTETKKIRNPYFGDKMPECGKIEEPL